MADLRLHTLPQGPTIEEYDLKSNSLYFSYLFFLFFASVRT